MNNINFAKSIEPDNADLLQRETNVKKLRAEKNPVYQLLWEKK